MYHGLDGREPRLGIDDGLALERSSHILSLSSGYSRRDQAVLDEGLTGIAMLNRSFCFWLWCLCSQVFVDELRSHNVTQFIRDLTFVPLTGWKVRKFPLPS